MMRSLYSAVSGLKSHQTKMDAVGNNIANVNTYGYKTQRVTFADTLYQTSSGASAPEGNRGGVNAKQIGLGVGVAAVDTIFTDQSKQSTGKNTDVALTGDGLFVVKDSSGVYYTRDGSFSFDADGNYVTSAGRFVQGKMATDGKLPVMDDNTTKITIQSGKSMEPMATTSSTYTNNVNSNPPGGKVSSITVGYKDGTSESVTNYDPGAAIFVHMNTSEGPRRVKADPDIGHTFTTGVAAGTIYKSKVASITATGPSTINLTVGKGMYSAINGATTFALNSAGIANGTYSIGSNYTTSKTVLSATADPSHPGSILVNFAPATPTDGITSVSIPDPGTITIAPGDPFTVTVPVISGVANTGAKVTMENGEVETMGVPDHSLTTTNMDGTTVYTPVFTPTVTADERNESILYFHNKEVNTVTLSTADGTSYTANKRQDYATNKEYYPPISTTVTVYDSLGNAHAVPILVGMKEKDSATGNKWIATLASSVLDDGTKLAMSDVEIQFDLEGKVKPSTQPGELTVAYANGASSSSGKQKVSIDFSTLTQYAGGNTIKNTANGNAQGTLQSLSIDSAGIINGTYTNGVIRAEAQIAVAQFNNAAGLTRVGGNYFQVSNNSGKANVKTASDLGITFSPGQLEMSGTDIANEFTEMITTQRGFQSNSKIITVGDEMLETVVNIKR